VVATRGSVEVLNGRMVRWLWDLPQGGEETIQIAAQSRPGFGQRHAPENTASLLYAESVADQASVTLAIGRGQAGAASPSPTQAPSPTATRRPRPRSGGDAYRLTSWPLCHAGAGCQQTPTPAPTSSLLPTTGQGASVVWPAAIFVWRCWHWACITMRRRPSAE